MQFLGRSMMRLVRGSRLFDRRYLGETITREDLVAASDWRRLLTNTLSRTTCRLLSFQALYFWHFVLRGLQAIEIPTLPSKNPRDEAAYMHNQQRGLLTRHYWLAMPASRHVPPSKPHPLTEYLPSMSLYFQAYSTRAPGRPSARVSTVSRLVFAIVPLPVIISYLASAAAGIVWS